LPPEATKNSLNLIASYSGNTEETLSSLEELRAKSISFIGLSSGGKVEQLCHDYGMPHVKLPIPFSNYQPRMGTGYFFGAMLQLITNHGLIPDQSTEIIREANLLRDKMADYENRGKELAKILNGKTPVIYSSAKYKPVAMVWKIKINENAKTPAFWNFFPELNHNEMVGYTNPQGKFILIMLKDPEDDPRNLRRYEATASLLSGKGIEFKIIEMEGTSLFSKMFLSIALADWTSYYLALEYNQDPTPVEMVEELKKILAS
jgi:glucose/mannose-6-phosphate isomerase